MGISAAAQLADWATEGRLVFDGLTASADQVSHLRAGPGIIDDKHYLARLPVAVGGRDDSDNGARPPFLGHLHRRWSGRSSRSRRISRVNGLQPAEETNTSRKV